MPELLRRSPYLVFYWKGDRLFIESYFTHAIVEADEVVLRVLKHFTDPQSPEQLAADLPIEQKNAFLQIVEELKFHTLLEKFDSTAEGRDRAMEIWDKWGIEARFFHWQTKDVRFMAPEKMKASDERRQRELGPPSSFKRYPGVPCLKLPALNPSITANFADVLHQRRTRRDFDGRPITLVELATLLRLTWGVDKWLENPLGRLPLKTSPSGGARHPIEVYVAVHNVEGLKPGLYHYSPDHHQLHILRLGNIRELAKPFCAGQWWTQSAAALFMMTAMFERTMWRYDFSRALRTIYMEAGHLCQTFCLTATALGLAPFCTAAIADSLIEREIGIDGISESVLYVTAVGHVHGEAEAVPL